MPFLPSMAFYRNQDAQLRRDLDQDADSHNSRLSVARYEAEAPFNWIRSLPPAAFQFDRAFGNRFCPRRHQLNECRRTRLPRNSPVSPCAASDRPTPHATPWRFD